MGTLSCDPTPQLTTAPLGRRGTECPIPETGLRKSCGAAAWEPGSGPGLYVLPSTVGYVNHDRTRAAGPAFSLLRRPSEAPPQDASPGPIYFLDPKVTRFGRSCTPAYSMQGRAKVRGVEVTPGPGAYSPEKVPPTHQRTPPAFTLGSRLRPQPLDTSVPAPNAYTLPSLWGSQVFTKPSSPSYTALGRPPPARPLQDPAETPGPGQYESPDPSTYRQRPPAFSMLGRPRPRPFNTPSPEGVPTSKARAPACSPGPCPPRRAVPTAMDALP
ncbi:outer dense fiber protein 3-like protein 2 [Choloepus didactylus]|uniref:outer dense fiber protein 3-like protein 2 n=1 Tax=Choloepus didactylus TaxID=27675 RepID=UPI0018A02674|nr:outer dense fiber protein 3-like protein 2 [Choloepus didactylus]